MLTRAELPTFAPGPLLPPPKSRQDQPVETPKTPVGPSAGPPAHKSFLFCPSCGEALPAPTLRFCPFCGFSLSEQAGSKSGK